MAGHSHSKNVANKKNAHGQTISKIFTNIGRLIRSAVKEYGTNIDNNPKLKNAIERAKQAGFPKDKINKILNAANSNLTQEKIIYQAYGPGNAPLIIEGATDNKNRTAGQVREILSKYSGKLQDCEHLFYQSALLIIGEDLAETDLLEFIQHGAEKIINTESETQIIFQKEGFANILPSLPYQDKIIFSGLGWIKKYPIEISPENQKKLELLRYELLDCDDINEAWI